MVNAWRRITGGCAIPEERLISGGEERRGVKWHDQMPSEGEKRWRKRKKGWKEDPREGSGGGVQVVVRGAERRRASCLAGDVERPAPKALGGEPWRTQFSTGRREGVTVLSLPGCEPPCEKPRDRPASLPICLLFGLRGHVACVDARYHSWRVGRKIRIGERGKHGWSLIVQLLFTVSFYREIACMYDSRVFDLVRSFSSPFFRRLWVVFRFAHERDRMRVSRPRVFSSKALGLRGRPSGIRVLASTVLATRTWTCNAFKRTRDFLCDTTTWTASCLVFKGVFLRCRQWRDKNGGRGVEGATDRGFFEVEEWSGYKVKCKVLLQSSWFLCGDDRGDLVDRSVARTLWTSLNDGICNNGGGEEYGLDYENFE